MTITFPRFLPVVRAPSDVQMRMINTTGVSESPLTYASQTFDWPGERWGVDITLPKMERPEAEVWIAWLASLQGRSKTFLIGDPNGQTPMGSARNADGLAIAGGSQTGRVLNMDGGPVSVSQYLKTGDYLQIGAGSTARLHKVLDDVATNGAGACSVDIWPALRSSPSDGADILVEGAVGRFSLVSDVREFTVDTAQLYGLTFSAQERLL